MRALPILVLSLSACAGGGNVVTYAGAVQPVSGTCDPASRAQLTLHKSVVLFAPASATVVLHGSMAGAAITAVDRVAGTDGKTYTRSLNARLRGPVIEGTYETPRCRYSVTLQATQD